MYKEQRSLAEGPERGSEGVWQVNTIAQVCGFNKWKDSNTIFRNQGESEDRSL